MPPALVALGSPEVVEQIIAFLDFFEQAAPLAASCSVTWHVLRFPLQDHAHNVRQYQEHQNMIWLREVEMQQLALDLDRDYWLVADAVGVWHVNDGQ